MHAESVKDLEHIINRLEAWGETHTQLARRQTDSHQERAHPKKLGGPEIIMSCLNCRSQRCRSFHFLGYRIFDCYECGIHDMWKENDGSYRVG